MQIQSFYKKLTFRFCDQLGGKENVIDEVNKIWGKKKKSSKERKKNELVFRPSFNKIYFFLFCSCWSALL